MPKLTITRNAATKAESYSLPAVAKMARVSIDFIIQCEQEGIVRSIHMAGQQFLDVDGVRRLIRARHLHQNLGLELTAIDCILRMRKQIISLQQELYEMEKHMAQREQSLLDEISRLRKRLS